MGFREFEERFLPYAPMRNCRPVGSSVDLSPRRSLVGILAPCSASVCQPPVSVAACAFCAKAM
eukprot:scaffold87089_cov32-Tisochrysis_lutea.AAC.1